MDTVIDLPDGARLVSQAGHAVHGTVLFVGRLNFMAGGVLRDRLAAMFLDSGLRFMVFEPPFEAACRHCDPRMVLDRLPGWVRLPLRGLLFLSRPRLWKFLSPSVRRHWKSVPACAQSLLQAGAALPAGPLYLVGYSQGARIASLAADAMSADGLVCFGYPFCHPQEPEDAARTAHLETLKTPCLILQGERDGYGGRTIAARYRLSPAITVEFLPADHELDLAPRQWQVIFQRLGRFVAHAA